MATAKSQLPTCSSNKKRKLSAFLQKPQYSGLRRWEDLDIDILKKIFERLTPRHLSCDVSLVCHSWGLACWDLLFWSGYKIDLSSSMLGVNSRTKTYKSLDYHHYCHPKEERYEPTLLDFKLMKVFKKILEGSDAYGRPLESWRKSVRIMFVPLSHNILDDHLAYIAERTPGLETLELLGSLRLTRKGFSKALPCWKNLHYLCLGNVFCRRFCGIMKELGKNCPGLRTLHLNHHFLDLISAFNIINNLPKLRILKLDYSDVFRDGMDTFFTRRHGLTEIHCCACYLRLAWRARSTDPTTRDFIIRFRRTKGNGQWAFEAGDIAVQSDMWCRFNKWINNKGDVVCSFEKAVRLGLIEL